MTESESIEVAPPVMTYETRASPLHHTKSVGDNFKVSCEALGSPKPEIFWFKDGQHIDESVHYRHGKSTLEFSILGTADAGVYTCRARNLIGEVTQNFTLEVRQPVGATHAIVTEAGPADTTVIAGDVATLQCRVKSLAPPHIKWLKRLEGHELSAENTLRVGNERYHILDANQDVATGNDEYLNKLVIKKASVEDSGMYICFVTNSGFGALTYKSMHLTVIKSKFIISMSICIFLHIWSAKTFLSYLSCFKNTQLTKCSFEMWFRLHLPSCGPGFESQAHHLHFFQFVLKL